VIVLGQTTINSNEDGSTLQTLALRRELTSLQFPPGGLEATGGAADMLAAMLGTCSIVLAKVCR
jgi:hypothetical protein